MDKNLLILGGTSEARELAGALAGRPGLSVTTSFSGATLFPRLPPGTVRQGGFGGADGLADYLAGQDIDLLIDATHPFATQISENAAKAAARTNVPRLMIVRPPWVRKPGDDWREVHDAETAAALLPELGRTVFLAIGRKNLRPFFAAPGMRYLLRAVDAPVGLAPNFTLLTAKGPFAVAAERDLMTAHGIEAIVAKNSGGDGARAKIDAARELALPVVMISRPPLPEGQWVPGVSEACDWISNLA